MANLIEMINMIRYGTWLFFTPDAVVVCQYGGSIYKLDINVYMYIGLIVGLLHMFIYLAADCDIFGPYDSERGDDE